MFSDYFLSYASAFESCDISTLLTYYTEPLVVFHKDQRFTFPKRSDFYTPVQDLLEIYKKKSFSKADIDLKKVHFLGKGNALVSVFWQLMSSNSGIPFSEFTTHYHLVQENDEWKIAVIIASEEDV